MKLKTRLVDETSGQDKGAGAGRCDNKHGELQMEAMMKGRRMEGRAAADGGEWEEDIRGGGEEKREGDLLLPAQGSGSS